MNVIRWSGLMLMTTLALTLLALTGCGKSSNQSKTAGLKPEPGVAKTGELAPEQEAKIKVALAKLSDADRLLAEAQKFCPVQKTRLGIMGKPDRIEIEGQPVFLCCSGCEDDARAAPKATLARVDEFKKAK